MQSCLQFFQFKFNYLFENMSGPSEDERRKMQDKVASDDKLTELNIQLNTKHRRYKALIDERKKLNDAIQEDD